MGSFQDLLNRLRGNDIPSQMPGAMGGGMGVGNATAVFDHGITGNLSDIQSRSIDYGVKGGLKQMPYMYGTQGGIQQMPYIERNRLIQKLLGESMIVPNTKSENSFGGNFESLLIPRRN